MPKLTAELSGQAGLGKASLPSTKKRSAHEPTSTPLAPLAVPMDNPRKFKKGRATTTSKNEPETFTISARDKEKYGALPPPCFRVETVDSGYKARLDYYDRDGTRRRPYCCYLNAKEGDALRRTFFEEAVLVIMRRVKERRPRTDTERYKIEALIATLELLTSS